MLSSCPTVILSFFFCCQAVNLSNCHVVKLSCCHTVMLSNWHAVILSNCQAVKLSPSHLVIVPYLHALLLLYFHAVILSCCYHVILLFWHILTHQGLFKIILQATNKNEMFKPLTIMLSARTLYLHIIYDQKHCSVSHKVFSATIQLPTSHLCRCLTHLVSRHQNIL